MGEDVEQDNGHMPPGVFLSARHKPAGAGIAPTDVV